ncbi:DEAD/DEAH box helicase [Paenibacillus wulumuqiensis]|uniref:DEAD/DEAH box helicase n=1 Tax=Paenibacillus wulumuqiensis TaxID=1567107 RepID=UPI000619DF17|nr:DEAD/DEAH box helicase [Paenibacillus wulumuqiensis]
MSTEFNLPSIQLWCGKTSYSKGMAYYRAGKVAFTRYDDHRRQYEASVQIRANQQEQVRLHFDEAGKAHAHCTCPSLASYTAYCQHVAAVMIHVYESGELGLPPVLAAGTDSSTPAAGHDLPELPVHPAAADREQQLAAELLSLFTSPPKRPGGRRNYFETRTALTIEWICRPVAYGNGQYRLGLEMKAGLKRPYVVQHIQELLECVRSRTSYVLSSRFTYDPELHSFSREDDEVIRQLLLIQRDEQPELPPDRLTGKRMGSKTAMPAAAVQHNQRILMIPVSHWPNLLQALIRTPVARLEYQGQTFAGITHHMGPLPLYFELDLLEKDDGDEDAYPQQSSSASRRKPKQNPRMYQLRMEGVQQMIVLESYGMVIHNGELISLKEEDCHRLSGLQQLLAASDHHQHRLIIPQEQLEPLVQQVIPGLTRLGNVQMTRRVSEVVVQTPLQARLYLDRVRDRLLAGLEFQYGDVIINPLSPTPAQEDERILLRDGEREEQILQLMDEGSFAATEGGYFLTDEEAEYEFLYHIVPRLEKLVQVYATSVVKSRIQDPLAPPRMTVHTDSRHDWLEFRFELDGIPESAIVQVLKSLQEQRRYYRLPTGAFLPLEDEQFRQVADFIRKTGMALPADDQALEDGVLFRIPLIHGLEALDAQDQNEVVRFDRSVRKLLENIRNPDLYDVPVPPLLAPILRDYQQYGYQWLRTLAHYGFGGILADDMGLGKTLQSITFIASVLSDIRSSGQPAIVVAPASLTYNWQYEFRRFTPDIRTAIIDGNRAQRERQWQEIQRSGSAGLSVDVIITSYPLLRRDVEYAGQGSYHTMILDEAQSFKNALTQTARAVKQINARHRFALTGTPIENSVYELWSIMHVIMPGLLGTRKEFADLEARTIAKRIRPFVLRRMKSDVLKELPDKLETTHVSELLPEQKKIYAAYLAQLQQDTLEHLYEKNFAEYQIRILAGLTRLRQICCHPGLFVEDYQGGSAKLEQLLEIINDCRDAGKRMLVFSQFTGMLSRIREELGQYNVPYFYLDGSTPSAERVELCRRFNEGEQDVFLISLKAGGTGLNLTGADTVILYDLWWNPAVEEQAADRAHRMGQQNRVQVIRMVARGTVEEKMLELQQTKKDLIDEIIQPGQEVKPMLTEQDIRELLMI